MIINLKYRIAFVFLLVVNIPGYALIKANNTGTQKKVIGLILDSSGSMKETDPNRARIKTAQKIIQMLSGDERLYIVSFDNEANWLNENNYDNWNTNQLISQINTIDSDGGTNIGASLLKMKEAISGTNKGAINGGVILFTDGKGDYTNEARWFQEKNIPIYTISFTDKGDALLMSKIANTTGGQYLMAKDETEAINALDYFFSKLYDFNLFFSGNDIIYSQITIFRHFNVDNHTKRLLISLSWLHGTMELRLTSPSGIEFNEKLYNPGIYTGTDFFKSDNFVSYKIFNAEKGLWKASIYGKDIPPGGENFVFNASGDSPYIVKLGASVDTTSGIIKFKFKGLKQKASVNMVVTTPKSDTIKIVNKKIISNLTFLPVAGEGNYNFNIQLSSKIDGDIINRQYYKSVLIGENVSSNIGTVQSVMGTVVTIDIGTWAGNTLGIDCIFYDANNKKLARGKVIGVKSNYSTVQLTQYYSNSTSNSIKPGNVVVLDYKQWLNDN